MAKMVPKIILEGTRLTHKTDLAFALNEHPRIVRITSYNVCYTKLLRLLVEHGIFQSH